MRRSKLLLPLCLGVATLAGCGQKGPLTLPPTKPAMASTVVAPATPASTVAPANPSGSNVPDGDQN